MNECIEGYWAKWGGVNIHYGLLLLLVWLTGNCKCNLIWLLQFVFLLWSIKFFVQIIHPEGWDDVYVVPRTTHTDTQQNGQDISIWYDIWWMDKLKLLYCFVCCTLKSLFLSFFVLCFVLFRFCFILFLFDLLWTARNENKHTYYMLSASASPPAWLPTLLLHRRLNIWIYVATNIPLLRFIFFHFHF